MEESMHHQKNSQSIKTQSAKKHKIHVIKAEFRVNFKVSFGLATLHFHEEYMEECLLTIGVCVFTRNSSPKTKKSFEQEDKIRNHDCPREIYTCS